MTIISPPDAPPASRDATGAVARPQWTFGRVLSRTIVILIGIAVGFFIALFIALASGWIPIC